MSKLNVRPTTPPVVSHEGAPASAPPRPLAELRRAVLSCLLWEDQFYESGVAIADRIAILVAQCEPGDVTALALQARTEFHLRHVPLRLMAALVEQQAKPTAEQIAAIIQRPDEMGELLAMLWKDGRKPVPKAVYRGISIALKRFSVHSLGKYKGARTAISLRDVVKLAHPVPDTSEQSALFKSILDGTLPIPDTWETQLSAGADKRETFERLINERSLGYLALLRNLRNMAESGVTSELVASAIRARGNGADKVFPFRFIAAANAAPQFAPPLDDALLATVAELPRFAGRTVILVDVSGSMDTKLSGKSDMTRMDAASALASIFPADSVRVFSFSTVMVEVPAFRGLAGAAMIRASQMHGDTKLGNAVATANTMPCDRLIVVTDEQATDGRVPPPTAARAYIINVASYRNGVSYGQWTKIDGFSEAVLRFMFETERDVAHQ